MVTERRWEEPLAKPLYVTFHRAAELLDMSYGQMRGLSFILDTPHFGEKGGAPRISMASIEEFIAIRDAGDDPFKVLAARKRFEGWSSLPPPPPRWTPPEPTYWQRRRRWRR